MLPRDGMAKLCALLVLSLSMQLAMAEEEEEEEEKPATRLAIGTAATLLGMMSFQMGLFHLTNHSDPDMRRYTYGIISSTVSIFCAVLVFTTINGIVEEHILEHLTPVQKWLANMLHMLFWNAMMQVCLAWICGAIGTVKTQPSQGDAETDASDEEMALKSNVKCFAVLIAHMAGFASINAWASMQQLEFFKSSWAMSFLVVPIALVSQVILEWITETIRIKIANMDDEVNQYEKTWEKETEECETDVMGLALSFTLTQAIRFLITNRLPNSEGKEVSFEVPTDHTHLQMICLMLAGFASALIMALIVGLSPHEEEEKVEEDSDAEGEEKKPLIEELKERTVEALIITFGMTFAWCNFYAFQMFLGSVNIINEDEMTLGLTLALCVSLVSFASIRVLDIIADADWTGEKVDQVIIQIIKALAILVGFGWEQCFDQAVDSIASRSPEPEWTELFLTFACVAVIIPAYKWYILPMEIHDGWRHGFVVKHLKVEDDPDLVHSLITHLHTRFNNQNMDEDRYKKLTSATEKLFQKVRGDSNKLDASLSMPLLGDQTELAKGDQTELAKGDPTQLAKLRRDQKAYKNAVADGLKMLKLLQEAEQQRALGCRQVNEQMDGVLNTFRQRESRGQKGGSAGASRV